LPLHVGQEGGGDWGSTGQAIIGQASPAPHGGGQGTGQEVAGGLVVGGPVVELAGHGGGQAMIAVPFVAPAGGHGGGHVGAALAAAASTQGGGHADVVSVAVRVVVEQGGGQVGCG
jgi:hypothetical protein